MIATNSRFGSIAESNAWHALRIRHQHEKMVSELLSNKGFETFLPIYSAVHRWKDRTKHLMMPLFPCYVFLRGGLDRRLQIITTPGVQEIVETASCPGVIPESEINSIRRAVENTLRIEPHPFLQIGEWVRILSGPLVGLEGILVNKQNQLRIVISIEILGRSVAIEVDASAVERINNPHTGKRTAPMIFQPA